MNDELTLELLKLDIMAKGSTVYDPLLKSLLKTAEEAIRREGASLKAESTEDNQLVASYAAWLWRQRKNPEMKMPVNVRYMLNNKIFAQKLAKEPLNRKSVRRIKLNAIRKLRTRRDCSDS